MCDSVYVLRGMASRTSSPWPSSDSSSPFVVLDSLPCITPPISQQRIPPMTKKSKEQIKLTLIVGLAELRRNLRSCVKTKKYMASHNKLQQAQQLIYPTKHKVNSSSSQILTVHRSIACTCEDKHFLLVQGHNAWTGAWILAINSGTITATPLLLSWSRWRNYFWQIIGKNQIRGLEITRFQY